MGLPSLTRVTVPVSDPLVWTENVMPLLAMPPTVTTTGPVVAEPGTGTVILVADQAVGEAVTPLNFTVLAPCEVPKFAPAIATDVPARPR